MKTILAEQFSRLELGQRGENFARQVIFDLAAWQETYGKGTPSLIAELPEHSVPYPCSTELEGDKLIWKISAADTSVAGKGRCELSYYVGDQLVKSAVFQTFIAESLADAGEVPDPYQSWLDEVLVAKNEAVEAKDAIENMSISVTALDENAAASVTKSETDGSIHLSFAIPRGVKGEKGEPGNAGKDGTNGVDGTDGYTPVRGVDFMTEADFAYFDAHIDERLGEVGTALDELHAYAQALVAGGEAV